jgi:hypothetical protein
MSTKEATSESPKKNRRMIWEKMMTVVAVYQEIPG